MSKSDSGTTPSNFSQNIDILISQFKTLSEALRVRECLDARQNTPTQRSTRPNDCSAANTAPSIASLIDHTLLRPDARREDVTRTCTEARTHGFATVCLNSTWIPLASQLLQASGVLPIAVVGFPLGAGSTASKACETRQAIADGAREIDMVIALGALKDGDYESVFRDIVAVVQAAHPYPVKVILENSALNLEEKIAACALSQSAGAAFVKTSTGFGSGGATVEDIALMRKIVGPTMGVKASGGVRTREDAERMIAAGANRIGASTSVAIVSQRGSPAVPTTPAPGKKTGY